MQRDGTHTPGYSLSGGGANLNGRQPEAGARIHGGRRPAHTVTFAVCPACPGRRGGDRRMMARLRRLVLIVGMVVVVVAAAKIASAAAFSTSDMPVFISATGEPLQVDSGEAAAASDGSKALLGGIGGRPTRGLGGLLGDPVRPLLDVTTGHPQPVHCQALPEEWRTAERKQRALLERTLFVESNGFEGWAQDVGHARAVRRLQRKIARQLSMQEQSAPNGQDWGGGEDGEEGVVEFDDESGVEPGGQELGPELDGDDGVEAALESDKQGWKPYTCISFSGEHRDAYSRREKQAQPLHTLAWAVNPLLLLATEPRLGMAMCFTRPSGAGTVLDKLKYQQTSGYFNRTESNIPAESECIGRRGVDPLEQPDAQRVPLVYTGGMPSGPFCMKTSVLMHVLDRWAHAAARAEFIRMNREDQDDPVERAIARAAAQRQSRLGAEQQARAMGSRDVPLADRKAMQADLQKKQRYCPELHAIADAGRDDPFAGALDSRDTHLAFSLSWRTWLVAMESALTDCGTSVTKAPVFLNRYHRTAFHEFDAACTARGALMNAVWKRNYLLLEQNFRRRFPQGYLDSNVPRPISWQNTGKKLSDLRDYLATTMTEVDREIRSKEQEQAQEQERANSAELGPARHRVGHRYSSTKATVILMSYPRSGALEHLPSLVRRYLECGKHLQKVVLVWNAESLASVPHELLSLLDNHGNETELEVVVTGSNSLNSRWNYDLVKPRTRAVIYSDDDEEFSCAWMPYMMQMWKRKPRSLLGISGRYFLRDSWSFTYRPLKCKRCNMVLPTGLMVHSAFLKVYNHPHLQGLREFVDDHPCHPDDLAVNTLWNVLTMQNPLPMDAELHARNLFEKVSGRNTLVSQGMAGQRTWVLLRTQAMRWIRGYFGGFYAAPAPVFWSDVGDFGWVSDTDMERLAPRDQLRA